MDLQTTLVTFLLGLGVLVLILFLGLLSYVLKTSTLHQTEYDQPIRTKKLLSDSEAAFYWTLKKANSDKYIIAFKVPLNNVLKPPLLEKSLYTMLQNGHVDFLLLHPRSCEPVAGIELDDSTHQTPAGSDRSKRKDILFARAGLPLNRFRVGENWSVEVVQSWINGLSKSQDNSIRSAK